VKKKWSDIKVDMKQRLAAHRRSVAKTGGGTREEGPTLLEQRVCAIMGDSALSGVVGTHVDDKDYPQGKYLYFCLTQQTCSYSNLVQKCAGEKVRHFTYYGLLTHRGCICLLFWKN